MPRGYYDDNGEFVQATTINNLIWKQQQSYHNHIICSQCHRSLLLFPLSKDHPAEYYSHNNGDQCNKHLPTATRNKCFIDAIHSAKSQFSLKVCQYNRQQKRWIFVSDVWIGSSRYDSERKQIQTDERDQIVKFIQNTIQDKLQITFATIEDLMFEG